jgi:F-box/WD-40 domain protein MET30
MSLSFITACADVQVWNFRNGHTFTLRGHDEWVNSVVLWDGKSSPGDMDPTVPTSLAQPRPSSPAPDATSAKPDIEPGTLLFSASDDSTVKLWDLTTQTCLRTFSGHRAAVQSLKVIVVDAIEGEDDDVQPSATSAAIRNGGAMIAAPISSASSFVAASVSTLTAALSQAPDDAIVTKPKEKGKANKGESVKKAVLVTGSLDGVVKMWNVDKGTEMKTLFG